MPARQIAPLSSQKIGCAAIVGNLLVATTKIGAAKMTTANARPDYPSLRYRRDRQRKLALQKPSLTLTRKTPSGRQSSRGFAIPTSAAAAVPAQSGGIRRG
jgi:hypothetical protein